MFEHSLAKVLEDPTDNNLPHYDEAIERKNTSLSPSGRNVIHPLQPRRNGATYSERTADGKIIKRSTQGGENLLPEKLQDLFALRLADSNALQRLGMQVDQNLEGTVAFTVQSGVPTATFRDNSNRTQAFEANQLATVTYQVCAVSISVKFARTVQVNNLERMSSYVEKMLLSEGGRVLEAACLTGTGASGQPEGIITNAEKSGSTASLVSFPTAGVDVSSLQDMLEDLVGKQAGIEPDQCGWIGRRGHLQNLARPQRSIRQVASGFHSDAQWQNHQRDDGFASGSFFKHASQQGAIGKLPTGSKASLLETWLGHHRQSLWRNWSSAGSCSVVLQSGFAKT